MFQILSLKEIKITDTVESYLVPLYNPSPSPSAVVNLIMLHKCYVCSHCDLLIQNNIYPKTISYNFCDFLNYTHGIFFCVGVYSVLLFISSWSEGLIH